MKRGSKLLKNKEKVEDSTENTEELHGENDYVPHCSFFVSIFNWLLQLAMAILRFLNFRVYPPIRLTSKDFYTDGSRPPPTTVDPPVDESGQEESEFAKVNPPPPPSPSNGGGGQTH